jgi:hypothetical protein
MLHVMASRQLFMSCVPDREVLGGVLPCGWAEVHIEWELEGKAGVHFGWLCQVVLPLPQGTPSTHRLHNSVILSKVFE